MIGRLSLVQRAFDDRGRLTCEARRMNPAAFASPPADACALGPPGTGADDFGPDRIARNLYDAASQLLVVQKAFGVTVANGFAVTLQQDYAHYEYSLNGKRKAVIDANGNRAEMSFDRYDRQARWIFPSPSAPGVANPADLEALDCWSPTADRSDAPHWVPVSVASGSGCSRLSRKFEGKAVDCARARAYPAAMICAASRYLAPPRPIRARHWKAQR